MMNRRDAIKQGALIAAGARTDVYPKTREHIDELLRRG